MLPIDIEEHHSLCHSVFTKKLIHDYLQAICPTLIGCCSATYWQIIARILWGLPGHFIHLCTKFGEDRLVRFGEIISTEIDRNVYGDSHVKM